MLTGIVQDDNGTYHANFENLSGGGLVKVNVGNPLARGKITEIRQDQVAYESNGNKVWVQTGNNLTGSDGGMSSGSSSSSGSSGPPVDPNAPGLTVEQRMRARRMAQMNGGGAAAAPSNNPPQGIATPNAAPAPGAGVPAAPQDVYGGPPQIIAVPQAAPPGAVEVNDANNRNFPSAPGGPPPGPAGGEGQ